MNKKAFYLNIYQALFILVVSWLYTFSTYHISFEILLCFYNIQYSYLLLVDYQYYTL